MKTNAFLFLMLCTCGWLVPAGMGQTPVTYTTTGVLYVQSGADKLGLNGTTFSVSNVLNEGQAPISGTQNQYATTVTFTDTSIGFSKSSPAVITINYVGPNSPSNNIMLASSISELGETINATSTISVPSIASLSPLPILTTPLSNNYQVDSLTLSDSSSSSVYGFTSGSISSVPIGNGCNFTVAPLTLAFPTTGGSSAVSITASSASCPWTAAASQPFIQLSATSGTGSGSVTVTTANNTGGSNLSGTATIAGQPVAVTQSGTVQCLFTVTPSFLNFTASGGEASLTITANAPSCTWTASANQSWITLGATGGTGTGTLPVTALSNSTSGTLTGTITVAGQSIPVTETATSPCTYSVSPAFISYDITGGVTTLAVTTSAPSCTWTAASSQTFATLSAASGTGSGTVQVTATANANTTSEGAVLTIAGQAIPLNEAGTAGGCSFTVAPATLNFPSAVTTLSGEVAASSSSCLWSVSLFPSWIRVSSTTGTGSGPISITATANTGALRTGNMIIAGTTIPLTQLSTAGCSFTVTPQTLNFGFAGGADSLNIVAIAPECTWTSSSNQPWTSLNPSTGTGSGTVAVIASPNETPTVLYGSLTVGGQPVTVTQGGLSGCYFFLSPTSLNFPGTGGSSTINVTASEPTCPWSAVPSASWLTFTNGSGTGSGSFQAVASPNTTSSPVAATATVGNSSVTVNESAGSACVFTLSSNALLFPTGGGSGLLTVTASAPSCTWTASSSALFVSLNTAGMTGTGAVIATAVSNTGAPPQSGILTVAGQTVTVNESGSCAYLLSPTSVALDSNGATVTVNLTATNSPCSWNAVSGASWATPSPASGSGTGSLTLTIPPNTTGVDRSTTIAVGGLTLPVSQATTVQLFSDVPPSAFYFDAVNLMATKGITTGCTPDDFCPGDSLTRAQMAIFLVRSVYGGNVFPYASTPLFNDVPSGSFGFQYIQALAALGITTGCGNNDFCPNEVVTRDQLAVFLIKARYGSTALYTYSTTPIFTDVPANYWAFAAIQRMDFDGITTGCGPSLYCPTDPATRGEAAVLLMRAMFNDLLPPATPVINGISPAVITQGQIQTFVVIGVGTHFVQGTTVVSPIPGLTIGAVTVNSPTTLTVNLSADTTAPVQPESIQVITGTEQAVLPNALSVQSSQPI